jgi:hypothetical protein
MLCKQIPINSEYMKTRFRRNKQRLITGIFEGNRAPDSIQTQCKSYTNICSIINTYITEYRHNKQTVVNKSKPLQNDSVKLDDTSVSRQTACVHETEPRGVCSSLPHPWGKPTSSTTQYKKTKSRYVKQLFMLFTQVSAPCSDVSYR